MSKMIRDRYDEVIEANRLGKPFNESEKFILCSDKIYEELSELVVTTYNDVEEYADLLESIYAMADCQGVSRDEIEIARLKKLEERGGFKKCLILKD